MLQKLKLLGILCLTMPTASCTTLSMLGEHDAVPSSSVQAIPCPSDPAISYFAPTSGRDVTAWIDGTMNDPSNGYDTPETVAKIRQHNAAIKAVCTESHAR